MHELRSTILGTAAVPVEAGTELGPLAVVSDHLVNKTREYRQRRSMNVGELKAALADCPDDMAVVVQEDDHRELDADVMLDMAVQYAPGRYDGRGRSWRWRAGHGPEDDQTEVLVIY